MDSIDANVLATLVDVLHVWKLVSRNYIVNVVAASFIHLFRVALNHRAVAILVQEQDLVAMTLIIIATRDLVLHARFFVNDGVTVTMNSALLYHAIKKTLAAVYRAAKICLVVDTNVLSLVTKGLVRYHVNNPVLFPEVYVAIPAGDLVMALLVLKAVANRMYR